MKYRVIGWTYYDDNSIKDKETTFAAWEAIKDEVREHGYEITGWHHQEWSNCTPVLNDGKKRTFSQRGWGKLMAEANGDIGAYAYARYTFIGPEIPDKYNLPERSPFKKVEKVSSLYETFSFPVTEEQLEDVKTQRTFSYIDCDEYRYLDKGDSALFVCGEKSVLREITGVEKVIDVTEEERIKFEIGEGFSSREEALKAYDERLKNAIVTVTLKLKKFKEEKQE